jgi:membrane-associated phospholipid phosphatase
MRSELPLLVAVQRRTARPLSLRGARALSRAGEHGAAWITVGLAGAAVDGPRRADWLSATAWVVTAHAASVGIKRVARRVRPEHASLTVHAAVPSAWSFPSSHVTSTTAAALLYGTLLGSRLPLLLPVAMAWSRLALGVHYPSDVVAGAGLGAAVAAAALRRHPRAE